MSESTTSYVIVNTVAAIKDHRIGVVHSWHHTLSGMLRERNRLPHGHFCFYEVDQRFSQNDSFSGEEGDELVYSDGWCYMEDYMEDDMVEGEEYNADIREHYDAFWTDMDDKGQREWMQIDHTPDYEEYGAWIISPAAAKFRAECAHILQVWELEEQIKQEERAAAVAEEVA